MVEIDLRTIYLRDLTVLGCTFQEDEVFVNLIQYVERGEVRPVVSGTYALADIRRAQEDFLSKKHVGKLVLIPPPLI
jgi:NADPH:quinone reductase-like Zn-dependent oxidoreductase